MRFTRPVLAVLGVIFSLFLAGGVAVLLQLGPLSVEAGQVLPQTASATSSPTRLSSEEELRELNPLNLLHAQPKWLEYQKGLDSSVHKRLDAAYVADAFRGLLWLRNGELSSCEWHCAELDASRGTNHISLPVGYLATEAAGPPSKPQRPIEYLTFWNPDTQQIETVTRAAGEPTVRLPEVLRRKSLKDLKVGEIAHMPPYALRTHQSNSRYCVLSDMPAWPEPVGSSGIYLVVSVKRISATKYWVMVPEGTHLEKFRKGEKCVAAEMFISRLY